MSNVKNYNLELPSDLHKQLKIKSIKEGRTMADIIIEALKEKLDERE